MTPNEKIKLAREAKLEKDISEWIEGLKKGDDRRRFLGDLQYPSRQRDKDRADIAILAKRIEDALPRLKKLIQTIRKDIKFMGEQTEICAAYLLLGKAFSNLETVIELAKQGKNLEVMEVTRAGKESVDLVMLFLEDSGKPLLEKWFKGATITNKHARKALHARLNSNLEEGAKTLPIAQMTEHMYSIYSMYAHSSYPALLESIDVYHEDLDFERYAGTHYAKRNFHAVYDLVSTIILQLKNIFVRLNSQERLVEADEIYKSVEIIRTPIPEMEKLVEKYQAGD